MFDAVKALELMEDSIESKKIVREMLEKEQQLAEVLSVALVQNPVQIMKGLRVASYDVTHTDEKTPLIQAIETLAATVKLLRFIGDTSRLDDLLSDHGISVSINDGKEFVDAPMSDSDRQYIEATYGTGSLPLDQMKTVQEFAYISYGESVQRRLDICAALKCRKDARKYVTKEMDLEVQEYNRLHGLLDLSMRDTDRDAVQAVKKKLAINISVSNYNRGLKLIGQHSGLKNRV